MIILDIINKKCVIESHYQLQIIDDQGRRTSLNSVGALWRGGELRGIPGVPGDDYARAPLEPPRVAPL